MACQKIMDHFFVFSKMTFDSPRLWKDQIKTVRALHSKGEGQ